MMSAHHVEILESRMMFAFGPVQPGDANLDGYFDEADIVQVLKAGKFLTGEPATWTDGDWDAAPGGDSESPPFGDGVFDGADINAAFLSRLYRDGQYAGVGAPISHARCPGGAGVSDDEQTSIVYDPSTGELAVDAPAGRDLNSILIESESGIFVGSSSRTLMGLFDIQSRNTIFKAVLAASFGDISLGNVVETGLTYEFLRSDLRIDGSLAGGGGLGNPDVLFLSTSGPYAIDTIDDITVAEGSRPVSRFAKLPRVFWSNSSEIDFRVAENSNPNLVTASIDTQGWLGLSFADGFSGTASITVQAFPRAEPGRPFGSCGTSSPADLTFSVTVTPRERASTPGDANGDGQFDQHDIVQVLQAGKYLSGDPATFAEGDWNGDGVFDQLDLVSALQTGDYLQDQQAVSLRPDSEMDLSTNEDGDQRSRFDIHMPLSRM